MYACFLRFEQNNRGCVTFWQVNLIVSESAACTYIARHVDFSIDLATSLKEKELLARRLYNK